MELIRKEELPLVAYQGMNSVHLKELDILNELYRALVEGAPVEKIDALLEGFIKDVEEHFSYEEDLMRKTHFFAYECHSGEHNRVRQELQEVKKRWQETRDREFLKSYFEKTFKPWITEHILTMDTVTSQWFARLLLGALP